MRRADSRSRRGRPATFTIVALGLVVAAACGGTDRPKGVVQGTMSALAAPVSTVVPPAPADTTPPTNPVAPAAPGTTAASAPAATGPSDSASSTNPGVVVTPSGVVVPVVADVDGGWAIRTPCGNDRTITAGTRVRDAAVVLDPGHGGDERGAVSPGGLAESGVNLAVARRAKSTLEAQGISVVLTRNADYRLELTPRTMMAKALGPQAFVSIHHNADPDGPWPRPGTETYYQQDSEDSKRLAGLIWEEVVQALSSYHAAWVADTDAGAKIRAGDHGDYYAVLRQSAPVVSALAELAFISNQPEADLLGRADVQTVEGDAVARAIVRYLHTSDPGSGFTNAYPRPPNPAPTGPEAPLPVCTDPAL